MVRHNSASTTTTPQHGPCHELASEPLIKNWPSAKLTHSLSLPARWHSPSLTRPLHRYRDTPETAGVIEYLPYAMAFGTAALGWLSADQTGASPPLIPQVG